MTEEQAMAERRIYEITGADREHFLQGLVSNDVRRLKDGPVYAALLTPQGKYLADFLLVPRGETILLDIDARIAEATVKRLAMYRLRAEVTIAPSALKLFRGTGPAPEGAVATRAIRRLAGGFTARPRGMTAVTGTRSGSRI